MPNFNLLDEKWIPVLYSNGDYTRLGIKKTFEDAHLIRQIAASNPMDRVSILRFLLAVLYWCKGNPPIDRNDLPLQFPKEWFNKLDENRDCFNLLGDGKRFFQDENSKLSSQLASTSLIHEIPTATNIHHFRHSIDNLEGLCPACCALGLLRLPVFTTIGGPGKSFGINKTPPLYIIPIGTSILETLFLSYKNISNLGYPIWNIKKGNDKSNNEVPLLEGLTDMPRLVWLDEPSAKGLCVKCGANENLIRKSVFKGNKTDKNESNQSPNIWSDPHVAYISNKSVGIDNPIKIWFKTDRQWNNILKYFFKSENLNPQKYLIVGFASDQAKHVDIWERTIDLTFDNDNEYKLKFSEKWDEQLKKVPKQIKDIRRQKDLKERISIRNFRPHIENQFLNNLTSIIDGTVEPWEFAKIEFNKIMPSVASSLSPGYECNQIRKKNRIKNTYPTLEIKVKKEKSIKNKGAK